MNGAKKFIQKRIVAKKLDNYYAGKRRRPTNPPQSDSIVPVIVFVFLSFLMGYGLTQTYVVRPNTLYPIKLLAQDMLKANSFCEGGCIAPKIFILEKVHSPEGFRFKDHDEFEKVCEEEGRRTLINNFTVGPPKQKEKPQGDRST